jgi:hypothetical protein
MKKVEKDKTTRPDMKEEQTERSIRDRDGKTNSWHGREKRLMNHPDL